MRSSVLIHLIDQTKTLSLRYVIRLFLDSSHAKSSVVLPYPESLKKSRFADTIVDWFLANQRARIFLVFFFL